MISNRRGSKANSNWELNPDRVVERNYGKPLTYKTWAKFNKAKRKNPNVINPPTEEELANMMKEYEQRK